MFKKLNDSFIERLIKAKDSFSSLGDIAKHSIIQEIIRDTDELISILRDKNIFEESEDNSDIPHQHIISMIDKSIFKESEDKDFGVEWHIIYTKLAEAFHQFYKKYKEKSGEKLFTQYKKEDKKFKILPWVKHFKDYNVSSLDPIHIFASFTYWNIPLETRKEKMLFFCKLLKSFKIDVNDLEADINKSISSNYQYFPHPNITYIVSARNHKTQKEVWKFFSLVFDNKDNDELKEIFNKININWYGVKIESVTIFAFWINSSNFLPLDKNTLDLLKNYTLDKIMRV